MSTSRTRIAGAILVAALSASLAACEASAEVDGDGISGTVDEPDDGGTDE